MALLVKDRAPPWLVPVPLSEPKTRLWRVIG
jgi:hypothetical protein